MSNTKRHRWGAPSRFLYKTERECTQCGLIKVTHHDEPGRYPVTWWKPSSSGTLWRLGHNIPTPACEPATVPA